MEAVYLELNVLGKSYATNRFYMQIWRMLSLILRPSVVQFDL